MFNFSIKTDITRISVVSGVENYVSDSFHRRCVTHACFKTFKWRFPLPITSAVSRTAANVFNLIHPILVRKGGEK
jgi:hypothetical protein